MNCKFGVSRMWFCRCVALLGVLCWCFCVSAQFQCLPQRSTALKFSMTSKRNQTGHWKAQVQLEHNATKKDTGPWEVLVDHTTAKCEDIETILIVATLAGPPQDVSSQKKLGPGYELIPGLGNYKFHAETKTWHEARDICVQEGAHLAIINSQREANALLHFWVPHPNIFNDWRNGWAHVGFHDQYVEGEYVTIFGDPLNSTGYMRWFTGQPNAIATENCGVADRGATLLGDVGCGVQLPFFCELEL